jgi:hypothetical protein
MHNIILGVSYFLFGIITLAITIKKHRESTKEAEYYYKERARLEEEHRNIPKRVEESKSEVVIRFEDIKDELRAEINKRIKYIDLGERLTLFKGFIKIHYEPEGLSPECILGGPAIPMVILVGEDSGQLYFFALKKLLPDIEI